MKYKRLKIFRTFGEIEHIKETITMMGRPSINKYLQAELRKLAKNFSECKKCVTPAGGDKEMIIISVDQEVYQILEELSKLMKKPIASIVDDLFIVPLLLPETE